MKNYAVTMYEKGYENFTSELTVSVEDKEHPSKKAIDLLCEIGWRVLRHNVKILKIIKVN